VDAPSKASYSVNADRPNLAIYPVDGDVEVEVLRGWMRSPQDPFSARQGWFSPGYQKVEATPCTVVRRRGPAPQVLENILVPAMPSDTPDIAAQRMAVTDGDKHPLQHTDVCALKILTRAGADLYVNDLRAKNLLTAQPRPKRIATGRFGEIEFSGKLLFIRLNAKGEPVFVRFAGGPPPTRAGLEIRPSKP
jgi:hypothetical protein